MKKSIVLLAKQALFKFMVIWYTLKKMMFCVVGDSQEEHTLLVEYII